MTLAADLRARLASSVARRVPRTGDVDADELLAAAPRHAAVLVAIADQPEPSIVLTQRPDTMPHHPGQVALPGGRVEPTDADAIAAALREAEEEVALPRAAVDVVGTLAPYRTITGFVIVPVIGVVAAGIALVPHDREVAAIFHMPLRLAIDPVAYTTRSVTIAGGQRDYLEQHWGGHRVWGATAAMLVNLGARLA